MQTLGIGSTASKPAQEIWLTECPDIVPLHFVCITPTLGQDISAATSGRFAVRQVNHPGVAIVHWPATIVSSWPAIVPGAPDAHNVLLQHLFTTGDFVAAAGPLDVKAFLTIPGLGDVPFASFRLPVIP